MNIRQSLGRASCDAANLRYPLPSLSSYWLALHPSATPLSPHTLPDSPLDPSMGLWGQGPDPHPAAQHLLSHPGPSHLLKRRDGQQALGSGRCPSRLGNVSSEGTAFLGINTETTALSQWGPRSFLLVGGGQPCPHSSACGSPRPALPWVCPSCCQLCMELAKAASRHLCVLRIKPRFCHLGLAPGDVHLPWLSWPSSGFLWSRMPTAVSAWRGR